ILAKNVSRARWFRSHEFELSIHLRGDELESLEVSSSDFGGAPAVIVDFPECVADVRKVEVAFSDVGEFVLGAGKSLHVELDDTLSEISNPIAGIAVLPVVANIELHPDPG